MCSVGRGVLVTENLAVLQRAEPERTRTLFVTPVGEGGGVALPHPVAFSRRGKTAGLAAPLVSFARQGRCGRPWWDRGGREGLPLSGLNSRRAQPLPAESFGGLKRGEGSVRSPPRLGCPVTDE